MNARITDAVRSVLRDLWERPQIKHQTKYEPVLDLLQDNPLVTMDQLLPIFRSSTNPEQMARNLISRLNEKLTPYGVRIVRVTAYRLEEIGHEE